MVKKYMFSGKSKILGLGFFVWVMLLSSQTSHAQLMVNGMITPEGLSSSRYYPRSYVQPALCINYTHHKNVFGGGIELTHIHPKLYTRAVYFLEYQRKFKVLRQDLYAGALVMNSFLTPFAFSNNYLVQLGSNTKQFRYRLGVLYRHFDLTKEGERRFPDHGLNVPQITGPQLVYELTYLFKEENSKWNGSVSTRNIDYFRIGGANEPSLFLKLMFKPIESLELNSEIVYNTKINVTESSTNFNADAFLRFGVVWRAFKPSER